MKLCMDCKHHIESVIDNTEMYERRDYCRVHVTEFIEPVYGRLEKIGEVICKEERMDKIYMNTDMLDISVCGIESRFFEPKKIKTKNWFA